MSICQFGEDPGVALQSQDRAQVRFRCRKPEWTESDVITPLFDTLQNIFQGIGCSTDELIRSQYATGFGNRIVR